jgi:hypothetical protein
MNNEGDAPHLWGNFSATVGQSDNMQTATVVELSCPVVSGTDFPVGSSSVVTVYGYANGSNGGGIRTQACSTFKGGGGGQCGTSKASTGTGVQNLQPTASGGFSSSDFNFVYVDLEPRAASGADNVLFGYTVAQ